MYKLLTMKTKNRTIGYIRVSTIEQAENGISLDNQEHKIKSYCDLKDLDLIDIIKDKGKSGKDMNREGLKSLLELCQNKKINSVVVYKLDRITRRTKDLLYLTEDVFIKKGINFYSINENIDTSTAQGKFFLTIMGALSQMERDLIAERTSDALQELKRQGKRLGSPKLIPYGFTANMRPKQKELAKVKEMFKLRRRGHTLEDIGTRYNKTKAGVKYILENPIYQKIS